MNQRQQEALIRRTRIVNFSILQQIYNAKLQDANGREIYRHQNFPDNFASSMHEQQTLNVE